jgi:hypothetical protein
MNIYDANCVLEFGPENDRVVFDNNCKLTAVMTHEGARGNDFVNCVRT